MKNWETHYTLDKVPKKFNGIYFGTLYMLECSTWTIIGATNSPYQMLQGIMRDMEVYSKTLPTKIILATPHVNYAKNRTTLHRHFKEYRRGNSNIFDVTIKEAYANLPILVFNTDCTNNEARANSILAYMKKVVLEGP